MNMLSTITSSTVCIMSSREIAELTGKRHDNVMADIRKMLVDLGLHAPDFSGTYITERGNKYECFNLPKRETLILVSGYSAELRAKIIDRWQELEARVTAPTPVALTHSYTDALAGMEVVARMLHLEGAAALGLIRKATALTAPHLLPALPVYAIDAPRKEDGELVNAAGSEVTAAISTLLKKHGSSMSAVKGNKALQQLGYLEQRTRPSSCGTEERKFWAVSKAGLKFGKNVTSPANPKEVQPHWYERTGAELVRLLESI